MIVFVVFKVVNKAKINQITFSVTKPKSVEYQISKSGKILLWPLFFCFCKIQFTKHVL